KTPLEVSIADKGVIEASARVSFSMLIGGHQVKGEFFILGIETLRLFGDILVNFDDHRLSFNHQGRKIVWRGEWTLERRHGQPLDNAGGLAARSNHVPSSDFSSHGNQREPGRWKKQYTTEAIREVARKWVFLNRVCAHEAITHKIQLEKGIVTTFIQLSHVERGG
ncbi:hypothetical protein SELMODRAFT_432259, partial [Selaginella moellendorffii]